MKFNPIKKILATKTNEKQRGVAELIRPTIALATPRTRRGRPKKSPGERVVKVSATIPAALASELKTRATASGMRVSSLVSAALQRFFADIR